MTAAAINTHGMVVDFGRHKGMLWTRVPVSYLRWLANEGAAERAAIARAELNRRGTVLPELDVSGHAIDRASLSCRHIWHATATDGEGLHAWLVRMATAALKDGERRDEKIAYAGLLFVFELQHEWPVLKTVIHDKHSKPREEH